MITYIYQFLYVNLCGPKKWFLRKILQEGADFTWRLSDFEELVGVTHWRWWAVDFSGLFFTTSQPPRR